MYSIATSALIAFVQLYEASASCIHNTQLHARAMEAAVQSIPLSDFSYLGVTGPTNWHALTDENVLCATGRHQSPIDIGTAEFMTTNPGDVRTEIPAGQKPTFTNKGTNVQVNIGGTTTVAGRHFTLKQFHYHAPGEHLFDEEFYPVEVHFVHEAEDNHDEIAVIGLLFQLTVGLNESTSDLSGVFSEVLEFVSPIATPGTSINLHPLDYAPFTSALSHLSFYTYSGSLTTPPCSEGVSWLVATKLLSMSVDTFNVLKSVVNFNSRFSQNLLGEENLLSLSRDALDRIEDDQGGNMDEQ